ncbi:MAG: helix-turn-helix domain-containing protein [Bacteroidota bacterium]
MSFQVPTMTEFNMLKAEVEALKQQLLLQSPGMPQFLTRSQAADFLDLSPATIDRLIKRGELEIKRQGLKQGKVLVSVQSLMQRKSGSGISQDNLSEEIRALRR